MIRLLAALALVACLGVPAAGQDVCPEVPIGRSDGRYATDPIALAEAWLPVLERMYSVIPSLSPREEIWLEQELIAPGDRPLRALRSREYVLREAKRDTGSLLAMTRHTIPNATNQAEMIQALVWFVYTLVDYDSSLYLAHLVNDNVIQRDDIPFDWRWLEGRGVSLRHAIHYGRIRLARHLLLCTLPLTAQR